MSSPAKTAGNQPHYPVSEIPRQLDDDDMAFIAEYTKRGQVDALREHVLRVWQRVKLEVCSHSFSVHDADWCWSTSHR